MVYMFADPLCQESSRNPPVMDGFLVQRVSNVGFDVFFVVSLNIELKEQ